MLPAPTLRRGAYLFLLSSVSLLALAPAPRAQEPEPSEQELPQEAAETALELEPITVEAAAEPAEPGVAEIDPAAPDRAPAADGGDLLRAVPGVAAGRMGGHGLEPVIRGQSQNRLNIIDGGAYTYGACPNRMDPPSAAAGFDRADAIRVERGYRTVTNGPGGAGGAVILERAAPVFEPGRWWSLSGGTDFTSNSDTTGANLRGAVSLGEGLYLKGFGDWRDADNYEDGAGQEVRSSFRQFGGGGEVGYALEGVELAFGVDYDRTEDALFPGAGMDSPLDETTVYRLRGRVDVSAGRLQEVEASGYLSQVDHIMDNYSLRVPPMNAARVPSFSDTFGGKLQGLWDVDPVALRVGLDLQSNNRDATFYSGPQAGVAAENDAFARFFMWPDVTIAQYGLYAEGESEIATDLTLTLGARYDYVRAEAGKADETPGGSALTPNDIYLAQYGVDFSDAKEEHNLGGLLRFDYALTSASTLYLGASRAARTADATERAMARTDWVGNPEIDPEAHHQIDLGIQIDHPGWSLGAGIYADRVSDFILRDAFSVPGVTIYRNIDATLAGFELSGAWRSGGFELSGDATYTYGENETDHQALAQIPPLSGALTASYGQDPWRVGTRLNWALQQDRVDLSRDAQETPGYAVVDLFGSLEVAEGVRVDLGVTNVLDEEYANHLNRSSISDPTEVQVNEPGRAGYARLNFRF